MKDAKIFNIPIVVIPERSSFSAWCPDLDVASQGDTVEEAIANIKEAIELYLEPIEDELISYEKPIFEEVAL